MGNIDKIQLPNGNTYNSKDNTQERSDHRHYDSDMVPLIHKKYESTSYYATSANDWNTSSWYFMSIRPNDWYKPWRVKFKVHSYCPTHTNVISYTWASVTGRADSTAFANWNERYDHAHYYIVCYPLKKAGFDAGYGHALGVSILYASSYTSSGYYRTFELDYYECENCTVTVLDTPVKWANWTGTGTTNYLNLVAMNAVDRGLQETGDANTIVNDRINYIAAKTGSKGIWAGSLFMEDANGTYQNICTASDGTVTSSNRTTATTKIANTNGFKVGSPIWYTTTTYAANTNISGSAVTFTAFSDLFDTRYSFNTTLTANFLTPYKPLYLVGTINASDGLFYLDSVWWTQTPNDTSKVYVLVGGVFDSTTSNCRATLYEDNKWFRYNGSNLIEIANDARTVNGHTVLKDVLSDAVFTDTTYSLGRSGENVTLTPTGGTAQSVTLSSLINGLSTGASELTANDYVVTQYVGGGTTTTSYHRRPANKVINSTLVKAALGTDTSTTTQFLNKKGEWATPAGTTYSGGTGISIGTGNAINHSNSVTAQTTQKVYPIKIDAQGHISAYGTSPTTLSGYGITDAKIASGTITLGSNTITPLTASSTLDATKLSGTIPSSCYTNTKNTAGSTDTSSKIFLIGATSQAANPQTYSQDTAYVDTNGHVYSNSKQVVNLSDTQALTNKTYNGYTLAAACAKAVVTSVDTSASLPTSNAVKTFVEGKGYVTTDTKNTAGSTDTSSKIFLIGATSQAANPQTYSDNEVFATSGVLTTKSVQIGGGSCTLQYNSITQSCDFVFS